MHVFEGNGADEVWRAAVEAFKSGAGQAQASRGGDTEELLRSVFVLENPRQRWITSRGPAMSAAFALAEVFWILSGRNDAGFVNFWNKELPKFSGGTETYHGAYGFRLRKHFGVDQLERAYRSLKSNPESRQVVLQIWDSPADLPDVDGQRVADDVPCNLCSILKIRSGRLDWTQVLRSNDIYRGVPYNFVQFTSLQEILAGWIGVDVGTYTHLSDSLHLYDQNKATVLAYSPIDPLPNEDDLRIDKTQFDLILSEIMATLGRFTNDDFSAEELIERVSCIRIPSAYKNILSLVAAEGARRRGWNDTPAQLMLGCNNPVLQQLWQQWGQRLRKKIPS